MSVLEALFAQQVRALRLPEPVREYRFDAIRRWKFDFAWPAQKVAVECEGGIWTSGRHTRGAGFEVDCEKYNAATLQGWRVVRFTSGMVKNGAAIDTLIGAMKRAV
jgi:very-short-patch-repair endonuclease